MKRLKWHAKSKKAKDFEAKRNALLEEAKAKGVDNNYLFATTFNRYEIQVRILLELEKKIEKEDTLVTKEYVKNRGNLYINPAITEYNKTSTAANQTATTLVKLMDNIGKEVEPDDGFSDFLCAKE